MENIVPVPMSAPYAAGKNVTRLSDTQLLNMPVAVASATIVGRVID